MPKRIHKDLIDKMSKQKVIYENVTEFSEILPMFSKRIIQDELVANSFSKLSDYHGKLYFAWGINWYTNTPTNYPTETHKELGFVNVYVNTVSLFGDSCSSFASGELSKALPDITVHFYDNWNSTFYFLPNEAKVGLDKLECWYVATLSKCEEYLKNKRKAELQKELEELQNETLG